jgi:peptidoglycan/LPS O-acetylase OafA/YrhL
MQQRINFANYLRGMACCFVVIAHIITVFFAPAVASRLTNMPQYSGVLPTQILPIYSLGINWAEIGVALFFIISGFVIPISLQKYESFQFLVARFFRIVPTYIIGFSITICALGLGAWYYGTHFSYSLWTVITNYALISDFVATASIDAVAWTLMTELKFYLLCAIIITWIKDSDYSKILLLCIALFISMKVLLDGLLWIPFSSVFLFNIPILTFMFIGSMLYFFYSGKINRIEMIVSIFTLSFLFIVEAFEGPTFTNGFFNGPMGYIIPYFEALGIFIICMIFSKHGSTIIPQNFITMKTESLLSFFADISYPLYIVHGVTNYVFMRILLDMGFSPLIVIGIALIDSVLIAFLLHVFIEVPTNEYGKVLAKKTETIRLKKYLYAILLER